MANRVRDYDLRVPKMVLLALSKIFLEWGEKPLIVGGGFSVQKGERIGLVGRNGAGKSTLLRVIYALWKKEPLKEDCHFEGKIVFAPALEPVFLPQEVKLVLKGKVKDYLAFERQQGRVMKILQRLGLAEEILEKHIGELSGGESTKVALAKIFLSKANLWLLDEPTNNLDLESSKFLSEMISAFKGGVLLVSHDRALLNKMDKIVEIDEETRKLRVWGGNYAFFWQKKQEEWQARYREYKEMVSQRKRLEEEARRLKQKAETFERQSKNAFWKSRGAKVAKRAKAILKRIERELDNIPEPQRPERPSFPNPNKDLPEKGTLLRVKDLSYKIGGRHLFQGVNLLVEYGDRVHISGQIGVGKSTLLKIIMGKIPPTTGEIYIREKATVGYLPQLPEIKDMSLKTKEYLCREYNLTEEQVKEILSRLKISEALHLPLKNLSVGEIRRIQLAVILFQKPDLLILDEPTNHLDVFTIEELLEALKGFKGGLIFVSHDLSFVRDLKPNKILKLPSGTGLKQKCC